MIHPLAPALTPLERHARSLAETAANWAAQQTSGRSPAWDEMDWTQQTTLAWAALTHIALSTAMTKVPIPEVVQ